jgi:zinc protease
MREFSSLCVAVGVVAGLIAPQTSALAQSLDRSRRPNVPAAAPFHFPATHERTLDNGLRVIIVENHALPLVVVRAVLGVDSLADPVGKEGLFALDTAMLREGTSSSTPEQQSATTAQLGSAVSPLRFTTITRNFAPSLAMMADMLAHPAFPSAALDRQKAALVAAADAQRQVPSTSARRIFYGKLFGAAHPMARAIQFSAASVGSITRDDVARFHDAYVRPNTTTLIVVGDVRAADVMPVITKAFADWKRGGASPPPTPPANPAPPTAIYLLDRPGIQQTLIFVGTLGPQRSSADFSALEMMGPILGGTPASRLQQNLRERHSYMYSATPATVVWRRPPMPSMIYGSAPIATTKTDSALIEWIGELRRIGEDAPSDDEMRLARGTLLGTLPAQIETDAGIADRVTYMVQNGLSLGYYDRYVNRIGGVASSEILEAAKRAVDIRKLVIVVAGDRKAIEPGLRAANIAPVVIVDENGNPIG